MLQQIQKFELVSEYTPTGDQPQAIDILVEGVRKGSIQTLIGVTGSGKTFSVANVIARTGKNTLVISHNKTLAAQLYSELKQFFPKNNVGYFVSYYDYYQPESYMPQTDTYIEKDTQINEKIERLRLEATAMLLSGEPTIIVSTVSCIYSLGNPQDWNDLAITVNVGDVLKRSDLIKKFIDARYERNDIEMTPGKFRVKGDTIDIIPAYSEDIVRISMFGDDIEKITLLDNVSLKEKRKISQMQIFPAKHYLIAKDVREKAVISIKSELEKRLPELNELEKQRLEMRTKYDLEMIEELGYCSGFFGDDYLLVIDESHVTLPQLHGMYKGDYSRKKELVTYGFRLPSAYDNRPLNFEEFEGYLKNVIFVSATPNEYEKKISSQIAEQLVRPTGLLDPLVEIRQTKDQMDDLIQEIGNRAAKNERVLVTTLTKRMAEDLAEYLSKKQVKVRYMHSEIEGLQRTELIRQLRLGEFDVLVGINLLREGLDIPEVSLVAILDADKEGFLRNFTSLIQTFGRASRNEHGSVIMYADNITKSMSHAIEETERRREKQTQYNVQHNITPQTIIKSVPEQITTLDESKLKSIHDLATDIIELESQMKKYSEELDFERAIECRDRIKRLEREIKFKDGRK
ncbi:MAG: uvrB [Nitrosarchaeum sp.]|nr:uvrB [Nitrosarchaeum sp.]